MTEAEARKKWCPFAQSRIVTLPKDHGRELHEYAPSQDNPDRPGVNCIASDCMAWRKLTGPNHEASYDEYDDFGYPPNHEEGSGCCGLAGKP